MPRGHFDRPVLASYKPASYLFVPRRPATGPGVVLFDQGGYSYGVEVPPRHVEMLPRHVEVLPRCVELPARFVDAIPLSVEVAARPVEARPWGVGIWLGHGGERARVAGWQPGGGGGSLSVEPGRAVLRAASIFHLENEADHRSALPSSR